MVETVVILAGGEGSRLRPFTNDIPKALVKVAGRELLYRIIKQLEELGVKRFVIVINEKFKGSIENFLKEHKFHAEIICNPHPEKENGYSLYLAKEKVKGRFGVVMSDHIYEKAFLEKALKGNGLIVDKVGLYIDRDEATKVKCKDGRIENIGKDLKEYEGFDTGFFILEDSIFSVAEEILKEKEVLTMSELAKSAGIPCTEVSGYFWMDIDTPKDIEKGKKLLVKTAIKGVGDGFISRNLNRKVSTRISPYLVDKFTPNQLTVFTFLLGMLSAVVAFFSPALGGILLQISSMLDGLDGEIARAQIRTTKFGAWLDSVLDRYVDFAFLSALAFYIKPSWAFMPWVFLALFGTIMVSYSTERYKGAYCEDAYAVIKELRYLLGKRDERIFLIMIFTLFGWIKALFILLAIITNIRVILTIYLVWKKKRNE
ncbi:MAG: CDP-alcohol phosphatidyltransferase [Aquifex sp.]|nr:MAG: CDP-alcohol phosphatidyltransferase [Aquifex sp.]